MAEKKKKQKAPKETRRRRVSLLKRFDTKALLVMLLSGLLVLVTFFIGSVPERYDLSVGSISRNTINASKDVVDEVTTEERKQAVAEAVEPTFRLQEGATESVMQNLQTVLEELQNVQQYGQTLCGEADAEAHAFNEEELAAAKEFLNSITLTDYQLTTLMRTSSEAFDTMAATVRTAVQNALGTTIREGQVSQSIQTILQIVGYRVDTTLYQTIVPTVLRTCVKANMVIDQETTQQARDKAMEAVEPVVYQQGQNIIREGERVTVRQLKMLSALGLLKGNDFDLTVYIGALLLVTAAMCAMLVMTALLEPEVLRQVRLAMVTGIVLVLTTVFSVVAMKLFNLYTAPVVMGAVLLTALISCRAGLAGTVSLSVIVSCLSLGSNNAFSAEMVYVLLTSLITGVFSSYFLRNSPLRLRLLLCGLATACISMILSAAIRLMTSAQNVEILLDEHALLIAAGNMVGCLLAMALQPLLESLFNLATPSKLMELANPNHPLLRRLQMEAPGTYHHSIIVSNLAETAAEKVGANALLCRIAAYYHDVGKLKRPMYFKENQMGENPHDHTDPRVSASILISHTHDGVQLAQKYRLPPEIQRIIMEHHGDTPVMYFYHKALQQADGNPVDINEFRYDGPRPSMKESSIIMLADTVEAAVRSLPDPTPQAIETNIEKLVRGKLEDGQLSNSPLTMRDIDQICETFASVLNGVFHQRIEYPKMPMPKRDFFELDNAQSDAQKEEKEKAETVSEALNETAGEEKQNDPAVGD